MCKRLKAWKGTILIADCHLMKLQHLLSAIHISHLLLISTGLLDYFLVPCVTRATTPLIITHQDNFPPPRTITPVGQLPPRAIIPIARTTNPTDNYPDRKVIGKKLECTALAVWKSG